MKLRNILLIVFMISTFLISCQGEKYIIKRDFPSYTGRYEKIPLRAGLYLNNKTRGYMMPIGENNKALTGEALESEAVESLGKAFLSVSLFTDKNKVPQDIDRIITIDFGPKTGTELMSKNYFPRIVKEWASTTELAYKLYDKNWAVLMEGSSVWQYTEGFSSPGFRFGTIGGAMGGYQAGSAGEGELSESITGSLVCALEKMNDQILSTMKNSVSYDWKGQTENLEAKKEFIIKGTGAKFVLIPAGTFAMGSSPEEPGRHSNETLHQVTISRPFYIQTTPVTQGQWKAVMKNNPSAYKDCGDDCPVEQVSWNDVQDFIKKLNSMERTDKYRLPTEAEWEYAARAGTKTRFFWGNQNDCSKANYGNSRASSECKGINPGKTIKVKSFSPNAWGLYDMHGNVAQWVQDWFGDYSSVNVTDPVGSCYGSNRVTRGGSFIRPVDYCRSASRGGGAPDKGYQFNGFRIARTH